MAGIYVAFIFLTSIDLFIALPQGSRYHRDTYGANRCDPPSRCQSNTIGERISSINLRYKVFSNPEFLKNFVRGFDTKIDPKTHRYRRNAGNDKEWAKSGDGLIYIPYEVRDTPTDMRVSENLAKAKREFEKHTCFRLIQRTDQYDYVDIHTENGCWTYVGKIGGRQPMSLAAGCEDMSIILHEFMHVIGFYHEQERMDRDEHIRVNWTNIADSARTQYKKNEYGDGFTHGKDYDIHSLMQYGRTAGASDRNYDALTPLKDPTATLGAPLGSSFTPGDILMLNLKSLCRVNVTVYGGPYASYSGGDNLP